MFDRTDLIRLLERYTVSNHPALGLHSVIPLPFPGDIKLSVRVGPLTASIPENARLWREVESVELALLENGKATRVKGYVPLEWVGLLLEQVTEGHIPTPEG